MSTKLNEKDFTLSFKKNFGKFVARKLSKKCKQCGNERFLSVIDHYLGKKQVCFQCQTASILTWPMIHPFLKRLSFSPRVS